MAQTKALVLCLFTVTLVTIFCTAEDVAKGDAHKTGNHSEVNGNHSEGEHGAHPHGVHVAGWQYQYVKTPFLITFFLIFALISKLAFHHVEWLSKVMPESCLLIVLGTIVGVIVYVSTDGIQITMSKELFFLYLLPPVILESAYSLHDRVFFDNIGTILIYAAIGTILNCFLIGCTLWGLALAGAMGTIDINLVQCLVFSGLIVAVDPVAVLAIFQEVGVNNVLYFLVFGESLLNDAVTVVIYNVMNAFNGMDTIPASEILKGIAAFFVVSLGGLFMGVCWGVLTAIVTKYTKHVRVIEPLAMFIFAYASYLSAELFHFSGIISCIGCGLIQAQYAFHNISSKSFTTVKYFSKMMSSTCDCIIFMFLGLSLVRDHVWHTGFTLWSLLLCFVYRFIIVYVLTFIANRRRKRKVNMVEQFIMAYGGLRGAVAFSLVAMIDSKALPHQQMFLTTTLVVILFTVFVQGMTIKPLVNCLRVTRETQKSICLIEEIHKNVTDHIMAGVEEISGHTGENAVREYLEHYDDKYIKKFLMRNPEKKDQNIMDLYKNMALQQHYDAIGAKGSALSSDVIGTVQPKKIDGKGFTNDPNMMHAHADRHEATKRRRQTVAGIVDFDERGIFARFRTNSRDLASLASGEPQLDDVHELLRQGATENAFRQRYDRNLKSEEETDLLYQLHEKQLRRDRFNKAKSMSQHPDGMAAAKRTGRQYHSLGRYFSAPEVITEGQPLRAQNAASNPPTENSFPVESDHLQSSEKSHLLRPDSSPTTPCPSGVVTADIARGLGSTPSAAGDPGDEWYDNVPRRSSTGDLNVNNNADVSGRKNSLVRQDARDPTTPPVPANPETYPLPTVKTTPESQDNGPDKESQI